MNFDHTFALQRAQELRQEANRERQARLARGSDQPRERNLISLLRVKAPALS